MEKQKEKKEKWEWILTEKINPYLSENEISDLINKKFAHIIIELENNPISKIKTKKVANEY